MTKSSQLFSWHGWAERFVVAQHGPQDVDLGGATLASAWLGSAQLPGADLRGVIPTDFWLDEADWTEVRNLTSSWIQPEVTTTPSCPPDCSGQPAGRPVRRLRRQQPTGKRWQSRSAVRQQEGDLPLTDCGDSIL